MTPYHQLVAEYARLMRAGKEYPLGDFLRAAYQTPDEAPVCLIFSPHPDDEVIVGGLALRLMRESRWKVIDCAVTLGSNRQRRPERLQELRSCCEYVGFQLIELAPSGLDQINLQTRSQAQALWKQSTELVAKVILDLNPKVIFFPHQADWNSTHIGTHYLVTDALRALGDNFSCYTVETEFWAAMTSPNLMVEISEETLGTLVCALSFHVGEVRRNPYHLSLPAWMIDNVRRGSELLYSKGAAAADLTFATLYRLGRWCKGELQAVDTAQVLNSKQSPSTLFHT